MRAEKNQRIIEALVRIQSVRFTEVEETLPFSAHAVVGNLKLTIPLPQELKEKEKVRLVKERDKLIALQNNQRAQLSNPGFLKKAPPQLVAKIQDSLSQGKGARGNSKKGGPSLEMRAPSATFFE